MHPKYQLTTALLAQWAGTDALLREMAKSDSELQDLRRCKETLWKWFTDKSDELQATQEELYRLEDDLNDAHAEVRYLREEVYGA